LDASCSSADVHYGAIPFPGAVDQGLPQGVPWVAGSSSRIVGVLFYFGSRPFDSTRLHRAVISTRGSTSSGSTKILWWVRGSGLGRGLTIAGHRVDGPGSFRERWGTALGTTTHPSIVSVPAVGCWQLHLRSGAISDDVTFQAVALHS